MPDQDRLYQLLPAVYRQRDVAFGHPLRELLRVLAREVDLVEADITRLYDNWFIETCDDWVVPYIADLIGFDPVSDTESAGSELKPRRQVANVVRARRRKGTLALLEELARDAAEWPACAVEYHRLVGVTRDLEHRRNDGGFADIRSPRTLELLETPFDRTAHTVDVRRPSLRRTPGRHHPTSVVLFAFVLRPFSVTRCRARNVEEPAPSCFTFSVLGNNAPLFTKPVEESDRCDIATPLNLPIPITRRALLEGKDAYYGEGKSFVIHTLDDVGREHPVPADAVVPADLSDWEAYRARRGKVLVDPMLGRMVFPEKELPRGVLVSYHYSFSAALGGGEYPRRLTQHREHPRTPTQGKPRGVYAVYRGNPDAKGRTIKGALDQWLHDQQAGGGKALDHAVIEIQDSSSYTEQIAVTLKKDQSLQIRAANRKRPVIRLLDVSDDAPDSLFIAGAEGARVTLDGLVIAGRPVHFEGKFAQIEIRHSTLVPGWGLEQTPDDPSAPPPPWRPEEPSLELYETGARVHVRQSILGSIQVLESAVHGDPIELVLEDSILDATSPDTDAISGVGTPTAHAAVTVRGCTVIGKVDVHAIELGENSIFAGRVAVARRNRGCLRYSSIDPCSRTPRRYQCQPDLAEASAGAEPEVREPARDRVRPQFESTSYGTPAYARLASSCDTAIRQGASDGGEMGVFHQLHEPARAALLRNLVAEHTPADMDAGVVLVVAKPEERR